MPAQCWLHPHGEEHDVRLLVGVRSEDAGVVPADRDCAQQRGFDDWIADASEINAEVIRS